METDITSTNFIFLIALISLGGFVDSIAGGGGIITLPAYLAFGIPPHIALGTNKFSGFFGTLFASAKYARHKVIDIHVAMYATSSSIIGSSIGSKIATITHEYLIYSMALIITPIVLIFFLLKDVILSNKSDKKTLSKTHIAIYSISTGITIGIYDGLFGPGTGTFMTISFNSIIGLNLITASGTARLCNLGSNFGSLLVFWYNSKILFPLAIFTALSGVAGNLLGSTIALKKGDKIIKPLITIIMLLLMIKIASDLYNFNTCKN